MYEKFRKLMKIVKKKIKDLIPADYNPRTLSDQQFSDLKRSFENLGTLEPAVININPDRKNIIISGHQRLKVAESLGMSSYPCVEVDFDIDKEKEANIRMNKNTGEWDMDALENFFDISDLNEWGFDDLNFDVDESFSDKDADDIPSKPKKAKTKPGDLYQLGEHRLLCGDSTNIKDVEKLMAGDLADMMFTDPPYGVDYEGKTKEKLKIKNDKMSETDLADLIISVFSAVDVVLRPGAYVLATVPAGPLHLIFAQDWKARGWLRQILVWNKDSMVLGHSEYHYKHEPILFGWKEGERLKNPDRTKTTVWDFDRPKASREHPTMKPVEMWEYGINNHSKKNDVVFEPFGGSGTALIACEKTSRKCRIMELDPVYCDVIVKRWEELTGKKAILI